MITPSVDNVIYSYLRATDDIVADGMTWYPRARDFCLTLDENLDKAAAIVAIISANTAWTANMTLARKAYEGVTALGFPDKVAKVARVFAGETPASVVRGQKVESFYACIVNPDANMPAVIDRHAFDIAINVRNYNGKRALGKKAYATFQSIYSEAADIAGITVPQMQAITWVEWRARNGINA